MVETSDIHSLLQTGSWTTSRARHPEPYEPQFPADDSVPPETHVPRTFSLGLHKKSHFPPPPIVEDEAESLAREHGGSLASSALDEEPKCRGDVDQEPIMLPAPGFNDERRFVIVSDAPGRGTSSASTSSSARTNNDREAHARKRSAHREPEGDAAHLKTSSSRPGLEERRKSYQDLPHIDTAVVEDPPSPTDMSRSKSAAHSRHRSRHESSDRRGHASSPSGDALLSPVIKHATKGRDRAYWDFNAGANAATVRNRPAWDDPRAAPPEKRKEKGQRVSQSLDAPLHKRSYSSTGRPPGFERPLPERHRHRDGSSSRQSPRGSPSRPDLLSSSPPYPPSASRAERPQARRTASYRTSGYRGSHAYLPIEDDEYMSDNYVKGQTFGRHRDSSGRHYDRSSLLSPDQAPSSRAEGSRSRGSTPLASPRASQGQFSSRPSPSRSKVVLDDDDRGAVDAPPRQRPRSTNEPPLSSSSPVTMPIPMSIPMPTRSEKATPTQSPLPSPTRRHQDSQEEEAPADPQSVVVRPGDIQITSYRKYLEDIQRGIVPAFTDCKRAIPVSGYFGWLTLPRAVNLDICPDCYEAEFAKTAYRHAFVPSPLRGADQAVSCDFTSSPWYRIAWLMTLKYRLPDLHLLQDVAAVTAKCQPCSGGRPSTRVWCGILDPYNRRPVPNFFVCYSCAMAVEAILPNLTGAFVPLEGPGVPTAGMCAMRFKPGRKRFVELFDLFETTSDRALLAQNAPPNLQGLADRVRDLSLTPECVRDEPVRDGKWFVMESVPDLTVCEECFDQVVWPVVELGDRGGIARNFFHRPQRRPLGACQLYSRRMREVFAKACRRNDVQYLDAKVKERLDIEGAIKAKLAENPGTDEARELIRKWEEWE